MTLKEEFEQAAKNVQSLKERPSNENLLLLYSLYKQATEGDAKGSRPGFLDMVGRRKFDAWLEKKGKPQEQSMRDYIELVKKLGA